MSIPASQPFGVVASTVTSAGVSVDVAFADGGGPQSVVIQNRGSVAIYLFADAAAQTAGTVHFDIAAGADSPTIWLGGKARRLFLTSSGADCATAVLVQR